MRERASAGKRFAGTIFAAFIFFAGPPAGAFADASGAVLFRESFDTASTANHDLYEADSAIHEVRRGRLTLFYHSQQKSAPAGIECRLPAADRNPAERVIDMSFLGGGTEMSNSMFVAYAVGPGKGWSLPALPAANRPNTRTGYIVRLIRHGDGSNEIKCYRNDTGWTAELLTARLPANPVTALRRIIIRHRRDGLHTVEVSLDTGVHSVTAFSFHDEMYPPGNRNRNIHWIMKGHGVIGVTIDVATDSWDVRDLDRPDTHAMRVEAAAEPPDDRLSGETDVKSLCGMARAAMDIGNFSDAHRCLQKAKVILQMTGRPSGSDMAHVLVLMAGLESARDPLSAESLYFEALSNFSILPDAGGSDAAGALVLLANLYMSANRFTDADQAFQEAIRLYRSRPEPVDAGIAVALVQTADLYIRYLNRTASAEPLLREALLVWGRAGETDTLRVSHAWLKLGVVYRHLNKLSETADALSRAVAIQSLHSDSDPTAPLSALHRLAQVSHMLMRLDESERCYRGVIGILEKTRGVRHPEIAIAKQNLANLYSSMKKYGKAEALYKEALDILVSDVGVNHPLSAKICENLALLYERMSKSVEARRYRNLAASIRRAAGGKK